MPKKIKSDEEFTKASVKVKTKKVLEKIAVDEGMYEYELIEKLLNDCYPKYFRGKITV